jgi:hypothetical protein
MTLSGESDIVTIKLGEPGVSDLILADLRRVQAHAGIETIDATLGYVVGYGIAALTKDGLLGIEAAERDVARMNP